MTESKTNKIERSTGSTESEQHLITLGNRTFLNLWSFGNLYIDKMVGTQGKELCDLLVVCGDDVIIFSDKTIEWPDGDLEVAWGRWYKRSIQKSVDQVNGAARWIRSNPQRIFLDRECTRPFPIPLPSADNKRLHGVVVARGAGKECQEYFGEGTGSLLLVGAAADQSAKVAGGFPPFTIGDVNPDKNVRARIGRWFPGLRHDRAGYDRGSDRLPFEERKAY